MTSTAPLPEDDHSLKLLSSSTVSIFSNSTLSSHCVEKLSLNIQVKDSNPKIQWSLIIFPYQKKYDVRISPKNGQTPFGYRPYARQVTQEETTNSPGAAARAPCKKAEPQGLSTHRLMICENPVGF